MAVSDEKLQALGDRLGYFLDSNDRSGVDRHQDDLVTLTASGTFIDVGTPLLAISGTELREAARILSALPHVKGRST